jgi:hypothetical protein
VSDRSESDALEVVAEAMLFGFPPAPVQVTLLQRSRGWRVGGAVRTFGLSVVVAPFVALFPPHAIWPIGALIAGAVLARRRLSERFTLLTLEGLCPKCGKALQMKRGRLRDPHPLPCDGCHHEGSLRFPEGALPSQA